MSEIEGKKLSELRVGDLKEELQKRKLETIGPKCALVTRLEKALKEEGIDTATYIFTPEKKSNSVAVMNIKEEPKDVEQNEKEAAEETEADDWQEGDEVDQVGDVDDECILVEEEPNVQELDDEEETHTEAEPKEKEEEQEKEKTKVPELNENATKPQMQEEEEEDDKVDHHDQEESLNLTIGEDEKMLLIEEETEEKIKQPEAIKNVKQGKSQSSKNEKEEKKTSRNDKENSTKDKEFNKPHNKRDDDAHTKKSTDSGSKTSSDKKQISGTSAKPTNKDDKEKSTTTTTTTSNCSTTNKNNNNAIATDANATKTSGSGVSSSKTSNSASTSTSRNLWVSGLSSVTRASDLKTVFSKYGKVIGAKVVTNTRTPGTRCYGYVTMATTTDASRCIDQLHHTELHGRIISVERTRNEIGNSMSKSAASSKSGATTTTTSNTDSKKTSSRANSKKKDDDKKTGSSSTLEKSKDHERSRHHSKSKDKSTKAAEGGGTTTTSVHARIGSMPGHINRRIDHNRPARSAFPPRRDAVDRQREERQRERDRERERVRQREMLNYQKIREERERQRLRERERELREEERRRREIRERQREEEQRLAAERRKLAQERERLEREKAELLRLERERQKLEREKIELERLELKRQQMKIMQARDEPPKRSVSKRTSVDRYADLPERKRTSANDSRFEAPPPPRFDTGLVTPRSYEKKREDFVSSSSASKRNVDDYSASTKRMEYASGSKRGALDDYAGVPTKRSYEEPKHSMSSSSKRNLDDYPASKRDDYGGKSTRDDYKREVDMRHIPTERAERGNSSYKRGGAMDDIRSTSSKRYDASANFGGNGSNSNAVWNNSTHLGHANGNSGSAGIAVLKPYVTNPWAKPVEEAWRPAPQPQDRYDRNYNERSGGGMYGAAQGRSQDRYGGQVSSRY